MVERADDPRKEVVVLILFAIAGVLDAITFLTYGAFVAAQTGNTVLLPIAVVADVPSLSWRSAAMSLVGFGLGALVGGRLSRGAEPDSVWRRSLSPGLFIEGGFVALAAIPAWVLTKDTVWGPALVVLFLGAGVGMQAALAYAMRFRNFSAVVVTGMMTTLFADSPMGAKRQGWRFDIGPLVALILGAAVGALTVRVHLDPAIAFLTVATVLIGLGAVLRRERSGATAPRP